MKRIICLLIVFVLVVSGLLGCTFNDIVDWLSTAITINNDNSIEWEEKIYCEIDIGDNFVPGEVIVVLDKAISEVNKIHSKNFFEGVSIENIEDLTHFSDPDVIVDKENFNQVLLLTLSERTKEAVVEAIKIIETIEGVKYVGANNIDELDAVCLNDPYYFSTTGEDYQWTLDSIEAPSVWKFINKKALFVI